MEDNKKKLWMRAGLDLLVSDEETAVILTANGDKAQETVVNLLKKGRFLFNGDSYVPTTVITDFNRDYGTSFNDDDELEFNLPIISGFQHTEFKDPRFVVAAACVSRLTPEDFIRCQGCLRDNGIPADETATVLQALCYILLGIETSDLLNWDGAEPPEL